MFGYKHKTYHQLSPFPLLPPFLQFTAGASMTALDTLNFYRLEEIFVLLSKTRTRTHAHTHAQAC